jgi:hypothetical protein
MVRGYIAQGFHIAKRTPAAITLTKAKQFVIIWAVIALLLCLLLFIIYLIVYALQTDHLVVIAVSGGQPASAYGAAVMTSWTGRLRPGLRMATTGGTASTGSP